MSPCEPARSVRRRPLDVAGDRARRRQAEQAQRLIEDALARQAAFPGALRAALLSTGPRRPDVLVLETVVDAEARWAAEHDLPETGLLLVRPDGYIGWAGREADGGLDDYLESWLLATTTSTSTGIGASHAE